MEDRRKGDVPVDDMRPLLNDAQLQTVDELAFHGWTLQHVRTNGLQDPLPVILSEEGTHIGTLDRDGRISINKNLRLRGNAEQAGNEAAVDSAPPAKPAWSEKRNGGMPVPENLKQYLSDEQLQKLRQIESFGWELKFVRRPLFQQPVAVVISPGSNQIGILEPDGRLNLQHDVELRIASPESGDSVAEK
jgi:hypothetical protein